MIQSHTVLMSSFQMPLRKQILARPGWANYWMRFVLHRKLGAGSRLPNATTGLKPLKVFIMATQKNLSAYTEKTEKKFRIHHAVSQTHTFFLSQMDHSDALSFSPVSKLFTLYVWYNPFPWDGTCSIKSRKKPFSRATNITHTNSHTHAHIHTHGACEDWKCI